MISGSLRHDERAAAHELGYIFTFLLGVVLLTMFSIWAWEIETDICATEVSAIQPRSGRNFQRSGKLRCYA